MCEFVHIARANDRKPTSGIVKFCSGVYVLPQYPKTAPHDGRTGEERLAILFQTEPQRLCASVYQHAARLDRPGPFVDLGGDEFGKVFRASALRRCNILTNRFEAFTDERQIEGGA